MNEWTGQQSVVNPSNAAGGAGPNSTTATMAQVQTPLPEPAPTGQSNSGGYPTQPIAPQSSGSKALWHERNDGLTIIAGYHFVVAALCLLGTLIMMIPTGILGIVSVVEDSDALIAMFIVGAIAIFTLGLSLLYLAVGYGLWTLKAWGRVAALALAVVSLFGFPIGTIPGGLTLWYLMRPDVAAKFEQT